jgi:hypothetical protein
MKIDLFPRTTPCALSDVLSYLCNSHAQVLSQTGSGKTILLGCSPNIHITIVYMKRQLDTRKCTITIQAITYTSEHRKFDFIAQPFYNKVSAIPCGTAVTCSAAKSTWTFTVAPQTGRSADSKLGLYKQLRLPRCLFKVCLQVASRFSTRKNGN